MNESTKTKSRSRNNDVSREVARTEKSERVSRADIEKYLSIVKGPLHVTEEEKQDKEFHHCWVDADRPARLDKYLDWGAEIVQRRDRNGKLTDDMCRDHGGCLVHIKIPMHVKQIIDELKKERRQSAQGKSFTQDGMTEFESREQAITNIKSNF